MNTIKISVLIDKLQKLQERCGGDPQVAFLVRDYFSQYHDRLSPNFHSEENFHEGTFTSGNGDEGYINLFFSFPTDRDPDSGQRKEAKITWRKVR